MLVRFKATTNHAIELFLQHFRDHDSHYRIINNLLFYDFGQDNTESREFCAVIEAFGFENIRHEDVESDPFLHVWRVDLFGGGLIHLAPEKNHTEDELFSYIQMLEKGQTVITSSEIVLAFFAENFGSQDYKITEIV